MGLTDPRGLLALALALPLVLLHLYRRRRRRVEVAFVPLLKETVGLTSALGWFRRIADAFSLALRLLALACLALALSGPRPAGAATPAQDLVIVIDADETALAVESAGPPPERRIDRARALAKAHIRAHAGGRVAVVLAGATPRIEVPPTSDLDAAVEGVRGTWRSDGTTDLAAAIAVGRAIPSDGRSVRTLVISSRPIPAGTPPAVEFEGAGTATDDQGFVDQSVVPAADGIRWSVSLTVHNFAPAPRTRRVVARLDPWGEGVFKEDLALEGHETKVVRFDALPRRGGSLLVAALEGEDALPENDVTVAYLAPFLRPTVLVVHGGAPRPFVTALLDAMGDGIDRDGSGSVLAADLEKAARRDVTIVDGVVLPPGVVTRGAWIFLAPFPAGAAPGRLPFTVGKAVKEPLVWRVEASHPLLRGVDLATAFVARGSAIGGAGSRGLAFAEGEPVLAEGEKDGVRWMAFGLDPDGSDLPLRAALPVLLRNAILRLAVAPTRPLKPFYRSGEVIEPRAAARGLEDAEFAWTELSKEPEPTAGALLGVLDASLGRERSFRATGRWPTAKAGPPRLAAMIPPEGSDPDRAFTATVDLDPARDITPGRPAAVPPPPAPPGPSDDEVAARWRRWLLYAAGLFLLFDLAVAAGNREKVARASRPAYSPGPKTAQP